MLGVIFLLVQGAMGVDINKLPQWTHISPMFARVGYTGRTVSDFTRVKVVPASGPIDLFELTTTCEAEEHDTCSLPSAIAYGSILLHLEECTKETANIVMKEALKMLEIPVIGMELIKVMVLQLDATKDGIHHHEIISYVTPMYEDVYFRHKINLGINYYLEIIDTKNSATHKVVVHLNVREHSFTLLQHTSTVPTAQRSQVIRPRILSYNVWNVNPPAEIYGRHRRWDMYNKRLDHLQTFLEEANADIIGFQEVRIDDSFGPVGYHAQAQHLLDRLSREEYPHYVYRGAMSYLNDRDPLEHIEEGPMIVSKYPIIHTDYKLLSRQVNDPNDVHQRLCLHAVVDVPNWGNIDVYVTHLSLSERSREQTMTEIWHYMQQGIGVTQVLLGDLNAEPSSRGIQFLQGKLTLSNEKTDLNDAWLEYHHNEPTNPDDMTFPSDAPVKRIDFILYRGKGSVESCDVIGQAPTKDTASNPKTVGMLESNSPIYASDHRGVIAQFHA
ncbi:hypothetical protein THRCLA_08200 [Thraustotheca clavata]|uniref:Endonuclease/exonuclease/phosphatase domain-containing protein n=1 Tax=Thraustotheca clavata TaxID=74557 RepID=A0A1V9Z8S2_9STRA|nr:hypothetical protein THRCLA_08200 [Thraustotheca clavata]